MKYQPILRNHQQMVRVVRDNPNSATSYQLGSAYGDSSDARVSPTEQRIRTLNSMNLPSTSIRRPEDPSVNGFLPTRAGSSLFHSLNDQTQDYMSGQGGPQAMRRGDAAPGTKMRTEISRDAFSKKIFTASQPFNNPADKQGEKKPQQSTHFSQGFNAFK